MEELGLYQMQEGAGLGTRFLRRYIYALQLAGFDIVVRRRARFSIPAQPLREALLLFGQQPGLQMTAQGPFVEGRTSTAVSGQLRAAAVLGQLQKGTGLTFRFNRIARVDKDGLDAFNMTIQASRSDVPGVLGPRDRPWSVIVSLEFATEAAARQFESYLKSGSERDSRNATQQP